MKRFRVTTKSVPVLTAGVVPMLVSGTQARAQGDLVALFSEAVPPNIMLLQDEVGSTVKDGGQQRGRRWDLLVRRVSRGRGRLGSHPGRRLGPTERAVDRAGGRLGLLSPGDS